MSKLFFFCALLFPLCVLAEAPADSGVEGTISISPVLGGPTRQGAPDSRPLPDTEFLVKQGEQVAASFRTDAAGRFRVSLREGSYTVARKSTSAMGSYGPFEVAVTKGKMTSVHWTCDSGIR